MYDKWEKGSRVLEMTPTFCLEAISLTKSHIEKTQMVSFIWGNKRLSWKNLIHLEFKGWEHWRQWIPERIQESFLGSTWVFVWWLSQSEFINGKNGRVGRIWVHLLLRHIKLVTIYSTTTDENNVKTSRRNIQQNIKKEPHKKGWGTGRPCSQDS